MTNNLSPKNMMMLALLGIGAYMLTMRKATAGTLGSSPKVSSTVPVVYRQNPTAAIQPQQQQQRAAGDQGVMAAGINLVSQLLSNNSTPLYRTPDFNPGYYPDTAGEAPAKAYYQANQDLFATNPPASFNQDPNLYVSTGGWADSQ